MSRALILLAMLMMPGAALAQPEDEALRQAREILRRHPVIDGHNDLPWVIRNSPVAPLDVHAYDLRRRTPGHTDLERIAAGGLGGQFWSVYIPGEIADSGYARVQLEQIDIGRRLIGMYDEFEWALTADDMERAMRAGRVGSVLGMEGGHAIENSLGALRAFYDLGVRYMTLTHNVTLDWADAGSAIPRHGGLTEFGREVVREMNRLGMLVDLSHVAPSVMSHALDVSVAPVIFSHSNARALTDVPRNVPDSILARMPRNGGVVMITFVPAFSNADVAQWSYVRRPQLQQELRRRLEGVADAAQRERITREFWAANPAPRATIRDVADHIEHVRRIAGIDHVGIGGDFDGIDDVVVGLEDVSTYPNLFAELIRRGWTEPELAKLANGNILRAWRQAEAAAARLQRERRPSTMTHERRR
jgi:membrane dipeptidase